MTSSTHSSTPALSLSSYSTSAGTSSLSTPSTSARETSATTSSSTLVTTSTSSTTSALPTTSATGTTGGDTRLPSVIIGQPTQSTAVPSGKYANNLAYSKQLNSVFAALTPDSPCAAGQVACIGTHAQGICGAGGKYQIVQCTGKQVCVALPMAGTDGVMIGCSDPQKAVDILDGKGGATSTAPATVASPVASSSVVSPSSATTSVAAVPTSTSAVPVTPVPTTTSTTQRPTTTTEEEKTVTSVSTLTTYITITREQPATTSAAPPPPPPATPTYSSGAAITVTQTLPSLPPAEPTHTRTSRHAPTKLRVIPVDENGDPEIPITDLETQPTAAAPGPPRTTSVVNGLPTVVFTVTQTQTQIQTTTVTARETVTLIIPK